MENVKLKTVNDFGEQWNHFTENEGYYATSELFRDITGPFYSELNLKNKVVLDIGSGTGRIVSMLLKEGTHHVYALEPSKAMDQCKKNTMADKDRVTYLQILGDELKMKNEMDYIFSFGVLHHIIEPMPVVIAAREALKPQGKFIAWFYGYEGNRTYLFLSTFLRTFTRVLPHKALVFLSHLLCYFASTYGTLCKIAKLPMKTYMDKHFMRLDWSVRVLTIYDQLNPEYAKYYKKNEVYKLFADAGFTNIELHHRHGYSWTVSATKT